MIVQEARRKQDNPGAVAYEKLFELLFSRHRIRRWRIGEEDVLRNLTREKLLDYYWSRYTPSNCIVSIVGDIDVDRTADLVELAYGGWDLPPGDIPDGPSEPDESTEPVLRVHLDDIEKATLAVGWKTVAYGHEDMFALDMLSEILSSGRGSRLYGALRRRGLVNSAGTSSMNFPGVGVFTGSVVTGDGKLNDALGVLMAELVGAAEGIGDDEVERARSLLRSRWARRLEGMDTQATTLASAEALGGYELAEEEMSRLLAVEPDEIRAVAHRYLSRSNAGAMLVAPTSFVQGSIEWPLNEAIVSSPERVARPGSEPSKSAPLPRVDSDATEPVVTDAGGCAVLSFPRQGSGLVHVGVYFRGLPLLEDARTAGLTALLARSAIRGAGGLSGEDLSVVAELLGDTISPVVGAEHMGWSMCVPRDSARESLQLLASVAMDARFAADQVALEAGLLRADAQRELDNLFRYPVQRAVALGLKDSVYGLPRLGDPEVVGDFNQDHVREWWDRMVLLKPLVSLVGDVRTEDAASAVEAAFGGLDLGSDEVAAPGADWSVSADRAVREKKQTALAMAFRGEPYSSGHRLPLRVASAILSGLAGRLFDSLREQRSLAYTVVAAPWFRSRVGAFLTYIATAPEREDEAREAMLAELADFRERGPSEEELARATSYVAGMQDVARQHIGAVAGELVSRYMMDNLEGFVAEADAIRRVSTGDVREAIMISIDPATRCEFVLGPERD